MQHEQSGRSRTDWGVRLLNDDGLNIRHVIDGSNRIDPILKESDGDRADDRCVAARENTVDLYPVNSGRKLYVAGARLVVDVG